MLIDLDLAIVNGNRTGAQHQTGTVEFMAIDILLGVEHTYRHDLESLFYVLCGPRAWERQFRCRLKEQPVHSVLRNWLGGSFRQIAKAKQASMHTDGFDGILAEFAPAFNVVKPLCQELRRIVSPYGRKIGPCYSNWLQYTVQSYH